MNCELLLPLLLRGVLTRKPIAMGWSRWREMGEREGRGLRSNVGVIVTTQL